MQLLLVEDNPRLVQTLELGLREEEFDVSSAVSGADALARAARPVLDVVVLDLGLPDMEGLEVLRRLRAGPQPQIPVLVLTARDAVEDRVQALDAGADDYLIKPFAFAELVARLRALTRRAAAPRFAPLTCGRVVVHDDRVVRCGDHSVTLSPREHAFLAYLIRRRGEVVPRVEILRDVFGYVGDPGTNAIDVHLAHLRRKLAGIPLTLETLRGTGLRVRAEEP